MPHGLPTIILATDADREINNSLSTCSGPPPKGEVDCVAEILVNGMPAVAGAWGPTLASVGCALTLHSVFCHGSPMVDYPPGSPVNRCELADLLVVMDFVTASGTDRTANLIQAKLDKHGSVAISAGTPMRQLNLYQRWPTFDFASKAYDPRTRDFVGAIIWPSIFHDAGRYGAIVLSLGTEEWRQIDPTLPTPFITGSGLTFGDFLAGLADAQPHYGAVAQHCIGPPPTTFDDWSYTVAELLDITYRHTHRALVRAGGSGTRGVTLPLLAPTIKSPAFFVSVVGPGGEGPPIGEGGRPQSPAGISIIHGIIEQVPRTEREP
jgi:hypothetical protein